jgi:2-hydroxychromene-2-carboxylate isomerase
MSERDDRRFHDQLDFIGVRAHVTATAVLQICAELHRAGVLDAAAMDRIKDAMAKEIALSRPRGVYGEEYANARRRLEELFAGRGRLASSAEELAGRE